jgi:hypothetical protein
MRWLLIVLLISVVSLLLVAGAVTWHVRRQRSNPTPGNPDSALPNEEQNPDQS